MLYNTEFVVDSKILCDFDSDSQVVFSPDQIVYLGESKLLNAKIGQQLERGKYQVDRAEISLDTIYTNSNILSKCITTVYCRKYDESEKNYLVEVLHAKTKLLRNICEQEKRK